MGICPSPQYELGPQSLAGGYVWNRGDAIWTGHAIRRLTRFDCASEILPRATGDHRGSNVPTMRNRIGDGGDRLGRIIYCLGSAGA